ncbi:MAG: hypothetical protein KJ556_20620 [Gammaproteobacteria bacterium]|nr:hypothetical protein [Gammaproteobacteria bacterium]
MNAKFLRLNMDDLMRGFVVSILSSVLSSAVVILQAGNLPTLAQLKTIALIGVSAGVSYLVKNLLTNSEDKLFKAEAKGGK